MTVQPTRAQLFINAQVEALAFHLLGLLGNSEMVDSDRGLLAREAKKRMKKSYGMEEVASILWGTRFTMQDVSDGLASSPEWGNVWMEHGGNPKFSPPKRHLRILAHAVLCVETLTYIAVCGRYRGEDGKVLSDLWRDRTGSPSAITKPPCRSTMRAPADDPSEYHAAAKYLSAPGDWE
jgi:hypothetical protein